MAAASPTITQRQVDDLARQLANRRRRHPEMAGITRRLVGNRRWRVHNVLDSPERRYTADGRRRMNDAEPAMQKAAAMTECFTAGVVSGARRFCLAGLPACVVVAVASSPRDWSAAPHVGGDGVRAAPWDARS
jgi:hypothetical protein